MGTHSLSLGASHLKAAVPGLYSGCLLGWAGKMNKDSMFMWRGKSRLQGEPWEGESRGPVRGPLRPGSGAITGHARAALRGAGKVAL